MLIKSFADSRQTAIAASSFAISAVSWGTQRIDVFGVAPDSSIWHKYHAGPSGWEPTTFETMNGTVDYAPAAVSWAAGRLDYFVVGDKTNGAYHK